ncbi:uncharacterized protein LOC109725186 isoform X1 [Ananas comosus]|uniref:Uncharacterized protein LOC109725186 isoform X1 n=2 Tax=Ananas comosus TaxID=4615 RepID=A0A6P5GW87_ANACO|nr:uncharacterized protein LOC109725186 isoform X1 [Ananas comosus]XP_020109871.1 uncharacterized protein LOC109725186 isoform X1 [Ananas comosus]
MAATTGLAPPSIGSAILVAEEDALVAERARARANLLMEFRKFSPPTYGGEIADPWLVVNWVDTMEELFEDLFIEEREKVPLAMRCLEGSAYTWLNGLRKTHATNNPFPSWSAFKKKFFEAFFPDSTKHQLEIDLYKLRQGSRTVLEYEREFSRLVHCIPYVIQSDRHKAEMFAAGIRPDIYQLVHVLNLPTYQEVVDRALHVEYGQTVTCTKREAMDKEKKKRPYSRSGEGSSCSKKPSKHPQCYFGAESALICSQQQRAQSCVICGGSHRVTSCPEGAGKCYQCGQSGHVKANCTDRSNVTQFVVSAPYTPQ